MVVLEGGRLVLDRQRQALSRLAAQECRLEVVVIGLHLVRRPAGDRLGPVVGEGQGADSERYPHRGHGARRRASSSRRRDLRASAPLYCDLARCVANRDRREHATICHVHDRQVAGDLVGHEGRAAVAARGDPVRRPAHRDGADHGAARRVDDPQFAGPWLTTSPVRPSGVNTARWGKAPAGTCATRCLLVVSSTCTAFDPARCSRATGHRAHVERARGLVSGTTPSCVREARSTTRSPCCPGAGTDVRAPSAAIALLCGCATGIRRRPCPRPCR